MTGDNAHSGTKGKSRFIRLVRNRWIWAVGLTLLAASCAPGLFNFDSGFVSDDTVVRGAVTAASPKSSPESSPGSSKGTADNTRAPLEISYLAAGNTSGRRVIFVHGTPGEAANFLDLLHRVPDDMEFVAIDRPGFGFTKPRRAVTALDAQAAAIRPLLVERDGKWPILVGHSLGGPIVAAAAANYPDRIDGIIELAGSLDPALEDVLWVQHVGNVPPFSWLLSASARHANRELIALEDELVALGDRLGDIRQPVIIVHGTQDRLVPYENVPYMQAKFSGARALDLITLDGANHFLPWNAADRILDAIRMLDTRIADLGDKALPQTCLAARHPGGPVPTGTQTTTRTALC